MTLAPTRAQRMKAAARNEGYADGMQYGIALERARILDMLKEIRHFRRCTDGGCIWGHPGGMHTNGGCQSLKGNMPEMRVELKNLASRICAIIDDLEKQNEEVLCQMQDKIHTIMKKQLRSTE